MRTHSKWNHASQASHWIISSVTNNRIQTHSCCTHRFRTNVHSLRVHSCASMLNNICSESSVTACMTCFRSLSFPLYWRIPSTNRKFFPLLRSIYSFLSPYHSGSILGWRCSKVCSLQLAAFSNLGMVRALSSRSTAQGGSASLFGQRPYPQCYYQLRCGMQ